jgi:hypothetical protein
VFSWSVNPRLSITPGAALIKQIMHSDSESAQVQGTRWGGKMTEGLAHTSVLGEGQHNLRSQHGHVLLPDLLPAPRHAEPHPDLDIGELSLELALFGVLAEPPAQETPSVSCRKWWRVGVDAVMPDSEPKLRMPSQGSAARVQ